MIIRTVFQVLSITNTFQTIFIASRMAEASRLERRASYVEVCSVDPKLHSDIIWNFVYQINCSRLH